MSNAICIQNLKKNFKVAKSVIGPIARFKAYLKPKYEILTAVDDISFEVQRGEKVAFIGPNGAGKSTTIKLLTGIFQPCSGSVKIFGQDPFLDRKKVAYKVGTVFGQRSQLWYHLPAYHSFKLLATIYEIDPKKFNHRLEYLIDAFQLASFIARPVKELSLGERMRCELVASLLHNPEILFLDEPTIGLDIISKDAIRKLIQERVELESTTVFLTSHDIADIEKVCDRIILINHGKVVVDDTVNSIKERYLKHKIISVKTMEKISWKSHAAIQPISTMNSFSKFAIDLKRMSPQEAVQHFAKNYQFSDIIIEDPPLEEIIKEIYNS